MKKTSGLRDTGRRNRFVICVAIPRVGQILRVLESRSHKLVLSQADGHMATLDGDIMCPEAAQDTGWTGTMLPAMHIHPTGSPPDASLMMLNVRLIDQPGGSSARSREIRRPTRIP